MEFSVILPVVHGGQFLAEAESTARALDFPRERFEVLLAGPAATRSAALNAACRRAAGRVLVFTDDDCVLPADWLRVLASVLAKNPDAAVIGGRDVLLQAALPFDLALDHVFNSFVGSGGLRHASGLRGSYYPKLWGMAVLREAADAVAMTRGELFDETLVVNEDVDLTARIRHSGRTILYAPEWVVNHHRDTTFWSFVRRSFLAARVSRSIGAQTFPHAALAGFVCGLALLPFLGGIWPAAHWVLAAIAGLYVLILLAEGIRAAVRSRSWRVALCVPCLLAACHLARGQGWLLGRQRGRM